MGRREPAPGESAESLPARIRDHTLTERKPRQGFPLLVQRSSVHPDRMDRTAPAFLDSEWSRAIVSRYWRVARRAPSQTAIYPNTTLATTLTSPTQWLPARTAVNVSYSKLEKVV